MSIINKDKKKNDKHVFKKGVNNSYAEQERGKTDFL